MSPTASPDPGWPDQRLVDACLEGDQQAWGALVDKYGQLVFTIARRYGAPRDEATDLFQAIWLDAYNDLAKLRKKDAFKPWLVSLANHKCYHWKRKHLRRQAHELGSVEVESVDDRSEEEPELIERLAREQLVREAVFSLASRCREMIRLLFFTQPPKPYKEVAETMGLAVGSIGFIRRRCLTRLEKALERHGLR